MFLIVQYFNNVTVIELIMQNSAIGIFEFNNVNCMRTFSLKSLVQFGITQLI